MVCAEAGAQGLSLGHIPEMLAVIAVGSADPHCDLCSSSRTLGSLFLVKNLGSGKIMSLTRGHHALG